MESETLLLNLGAQAAAALMVLTATARIQAAVHPKVERPTGGQLLSDMKQRWLPANGRQG